jgi:hypothetical protein
MRPNFIGTFSIPRISIGTIDKTAAEADNALGVDERNFQSIKDLDNAVYWVFPKALSAVEIEFLLTTNDADVDIDIWTGELAMDPSHQSDVDCDLQRKGTLDVICGQQDVYGTTKHYADTINVSNDAVYGSIGTSIPGANHIARITFDMKGSNLLVLHGYGTFDEDCEVRVKGYS